VFPKKEHVTVWKRNYTLITFIEKYNIKIAVNKRGTNC
jgi:hypothetical protein